MVRTRSPSPPARGSNQYYYNQNQRYFPRTRNYLSNYLNHYIQRIKRAKRYLPPRVSNLKRLRRYMFPTAAEKKENENYQFELLRQEIQRRTNNMLRQQNYEKYLANLRYRNSLAANRIHRNAEEANRIRRNAEEANRRRRNAEANRIRRNAEEANRRRRNAEEANRRRRNAISQLRNANSVHNALVIAGLIKRINKWNKLTDKKKINQLYLKIHPNKAKKNKNILEPYLHVLSELKNLTKR